MMKRRCIHRIGRLAILALVPVSIQFALTSAVDARPGVVTPRVFPPPVSPYGHTYGEWSAIFFQSLLANPFDPDAYSVGESGHVLFLSSPAGPAQVYTSMKSALVRPSS